MAPAKISQKQIGMETFVAAISHAQANPTELARLMAGPPPPAPPPPLPPAASEKLADGVYRITGGYVSLAVEFKDHVVVLEGGQSEARGLAVIAETKKLFPGKRIKYVVVHASTFRSFEWTAAVCRRGRHDPRRRQREVLHAGIARHAAHAGRRRHGEVDKKPKVEGVIEQMELKDDTRSLMLYHVDKLEHSDSMLIAYLPKEKILFTRGLQRAAAPASPSARRSRRSWSTSIGWRSTSSGT